MVKQWKQIPKYYFQSFNLKQDVHIKQKKKKKKENSGRLAKCSMGTPYRSGYFHIFCRDK